eukprot:1860385-Prorocentrum_lima.AAC.1
MTSSLVGSEMCIRDSLWAGGVAPLTRMSAVMLFGWQSDHRDAVQRRSIAFSTRARPSTRSGRSRQNR